MTAPPTPGALLQEALAARHWTQLDLADVLDRPAQWVSMVATGHKAITRESAMQLGAALGTTAEFWLQAQDAHRLHLLGQDPVHRARLEAIRERAGAAEQLAKEAVAWRMGRRQRRSRLPR